MPDAPCAVFRINLHHIEAAWRHISLPIMVHHVPHSRTNDVLLLAPAYRRRGRSVTRASPRLYLDEGQRLSVPRNQVDFPHRCSILPFENRITFLLKVSGGNFLAPVPQSLLVHGIGLFLAPAFVSMR